MLKGFQLIIYIICLSIMQFAEKQNFSFVLSSKVVKTVSTQINAIQFIFLETDGSKVRNQNHCMVLA